MGRKAYTDEHNEMVSHVVADLCYVPKAESERRLNAVAIRR